MGPLTPDEVLAAARRDVPGLGIATVYRNLKALVDDGWAAPVELPGDPTRWEPAGRPHHHHFVCRACSGAFDVDGCRADLRKDLPPGFRLEDHEVVLYGTCAACGAASA